MSQSTSIVPLAPATYEAFFAYLNDQLKDNGQGGTPLFQPDMFRIDGERHGYTYMSRPLRR
jgi:hypothetical protein